MKPNIDTGTVRRVRNVASLAILVAIVLPFAVFTVPQLAGASHSYVVMSSSMSPSIHAGDVVLVSDVSAAQIEEGDVVTFEPPAGHAEGGAERVTHRVTAVIQRDDGRYFRTKGDANEEPDRRLVPAENVVGRVALTIPAIGQVILFAASDDGILLFVVAPAVLLMANEVWTLGKAARQSSTGREDRRDDADEQLNDPASEGGD